MLGFGKGNNIKLHLHLQNRCLRNKDQETVVAVPEAVVRAQRRAIDPSTAWEYIFGLAQ